MDFSIIDLSKYKKFNIYYSGKIIVIHMLFIFEIHSTLIF